MLNERHLYYLLLISKNRMYDLKIIPTLINWKVFTGWKSGQIFYFHCLLLLLLLLHHCLHIVLLLLYYVTNFWFSFSYSFFTSFLPLSNFFLWLSFLLLLLSLFHFLFLLFLPHCNLLNFFLSVLFFVRSLQFRCELPSSLSVFAIYRYFHQFIILAFTTCILRHKKNEPARLCI